MAQIFQNNSGSPYTTASLTGVAFAGGATGTSFGAFSIQDTSSPQPIVNRCAKEGHSMFSECELEDGGITGMCEQCGEIIKGRRSAGGLAVLQLRKALEDVLAGDKDILTEEFLALADQVEAEEAALAEARSLLRLAERVLLRDRVIA